MIAQRRANRGGYTLLELVVVLAVIILIGALVSQSLTSQEGNSKVQAAADDVTGDIGQARAHAIEEGRNYRISMSQDGTKLRVAPDDPAALQATGDDQAKPYVTEKVMPSNVMLYRDPSKVENTTADSDGWVRLATFQQDGTCKEDLVEFQIQEPGVIPLIVQIRGLTGHVTVNPAAKQ